MNNNSDNTFDAGIPSSSELPNLVTFGAVDHAGGRTGFTSTGKNVRLYASGYNVASMVSGGAHVQESGTSMAAPQVTNLAAKLIAIDPKLTPAQTIALINESRSGRLARHRDDQSEDGNGPSLEPTQVWKGVHSFGCEIAHRQTAVAGAPDAPFSASVDCEEDRKPGGLVTVLSKREIYHANDSKVRLSQLPQPILSKSVVFTQAFSTTALSRTSLLPQRTSFGSGRMSLRFQGLS